MKTEMFVVRVLGTRDYFPSLGARQKRGYSHYEPSPQGGAWGPRLFHSKQAARSAIGQWRLGVHEYTEGGRASFDSFGYDDPKLKPRAVPSRKALALEIVPAIVSIRENQ